MNEAVSSSEAQIWLWVRSQITDKGKRKNRWPADEFTVIKVALIIYTIYFVLIISHNNESKRMLWKV